MSDFLKTLGWRKPSRSAPRQVAMGVALGVLIGLLPKDTLFPWAFALLALALPISLGATTLFAILSSLIGAALDPVAHSVGQQILAVDFFRQTIAEIHALPILAWARLDNTVALGFLLIGLVAFLPVYSCSRWILARHSDNPTSTVDSPRIARPTLQES